MTFEINIRNTMCRGASLLLMLLAMSFLSPACSNDQRVTAKILELETAIQEQLPIGSSPDEVIGFLQRHGIEHSNYHNDSRLITGIIRDVQKGLLTSGSVQLEFVFDNHKLTKYSVTEVFTGL